jgi:hypothetical protein
LIAVEESIEIIRCSSESIKRFAWARIVSAQFFREFFVAMHDSVAFPDLRFGWEALLTLVRDLESTPVRHIWFA